MSWRVAFVKRRGGIEIDAGAQYEPLVKDGLPPGWSAFMALAVQGCSKWDQPPVSDNRRSDVGDVPTDFMLSRNGIAQLSMGSFPPITNNVQEVTRRPVNVASVKMKRNIGLTQQLGFNPDGSYVLQTRFSGGKVRHWKQNRRQWFLEPPQDWPVNGSNTENKPPGQNPGGTRYINSESPWQRREPGGAEQSPTAHAPNRYVEETVNIDLRGKAQLAKKPLQKGNPHPHS